MMDSKDFKSDTAGTYKHHQKAPYLATEEEFAKDLHVIKNLERLVNQEADLEDPTPKMDISDRNQGDMAFETANKEMKDLTERLMDSQFKGEDGGDELYNKIHDFQIEHPNYKVKLSELTGGFSANANQKKDPDDLLTEKGDDFIDSLEDGDLFSNSKTTEDSSLKQLQLKLKKAFKLESGILGGAKKKNVPFSDVPSKPTFGLSKKLSSLNDIQGLKATGFTKEKEDSDKISDKIKKTKSDISKLNIKYWPQFKDHDVSFNNFLKDMKDSAVVTIDDTHEDNDDGDDENKRGQEKEVLDDDNDNDVDNDVDVVDDMEKANQNVNDEDLENWPSPNTKETKVNRDQTSTPKRPPVSTLEKPRKVGSNLNRWAKLSYPGRTGHKRKNVDRYVAPNNITHLGIMDKSHEKIALNLTHSEWHKKTHGHRDLVIAGCVVAAVGALMIVLAIIYRVMHWKKSSNKNNNKRYRRLGNRRERERLNQDNYSLFPLSTSEEEDNYT